MGVADTAFDEQVCYLVSGHICSSTTPSEFFVEVFLKMTFQYDEYEFSVAVGRATWTNLQQRLEDRSLSDSPNVDFNQAVKDLDHKKTNVKYDVDSGLNRTLCEHCRRLLQGAGHPMGTIIHDPETGLFYSHWAGYYLAKSAFSGCLLCLLIYRSFGSTRLTRSKEEEFPGSYDFARYLSMEENVNRFILRNFRHAVVSDGAQELIKRTHYSSITLQNIQCEVFLKALPDSALT